MNKRKITLLIALLVIVASSISGQNVLRLRPYDGSASSFLIAQIKADTAANKGILKTDRVYELEAGQLYLSNEQFNVAVGLTLRLRGTAGKKPIIYLFPTGTGANPQRPPGYFAQLVGGNIEMTNIALTGFFEPDPNTFDNVQGGLINTSQAGSSIILDNCILSNVNGNHVRTGSATVLVKITNSIFSNMGALITSNLGAGKGIDLREASCDKLELVNNTFVNYQDRVVRHYNFSNPLAGTGNIKECLIDHNTFVNGMGYHGLLSLGNVGKNVRITNNLFVDAFALGEDPSDATRSAEWANTGEKYPNGQNRQMWIFTAPNDTTQWIVKNNVYSISAEGQAYFDANANIPITEGKPLSWHINKRIGADSVNAFKKISVALNKIPRLMTNMMNWYISPSGGNRTKNTPSTLWNKNLHDMDRRVIEYYRDTMNCAYSTSSQAYTAGYKNFPVGDLNWFPTKKAEWIAAGGTSVKQVEGIPTDFALYQNYPNPFNPTTNIKFSLPKATVTSLIIYNILGQKVATLLDNETQSAGVYEFTWNGNDMNGNPLASGIYFYQLKTNDYSITKKMMFLK